MVDRHVVEYLVMFLGRSQAVSKQSIGSHYYDWYQCREWKQFCAIVMTAIDCLVAVGCLFLACNPTVY